MSNLFQRIRRGHRLPPGAIKQSIDDLPDGLCFSDASGRIILVSRRMGELAAVLIGSYPQMQSELANALAAPDASCGVSRIEGEPPLHRFPDGSVWRFRTVSLTEMPGYTQSLAQNVTELYEGNARLLTDNIELRRVNQRLKEMYAQMADRIREQETLDLRIRVHNDMGASLIALSELQSGGAGPEVDKQLAALMNAVGYFSNDRPAAQGTFDEVRQKAAEMNVELALDGYIPQNADIESLIIAAAHECVTNCVKHAGGSRVLVKLTAHPDVCTVTITNNGAIPKQKIIEGGGLSALRHKVERAGGEMHLAHKPVFALILNLPRKDVTP